jgi:hypothetical protein
MVNINRAATVGLPIPAAIGVFLLAQLLLNNGKSMSQCLGQPSRNPPNHCLKEDSAMNRSHHLAIAVCLFSFIATPLIATASTAAAANDDADIIRWERSHAAYVRDVELSSAAEDQALYCDQYATKANLIKARYFIKLAEIDDVDLKQSQQASLDLQRARYYLSLSRGNLKHNERAEVQHIIDKLQADHLAPMQACNDVVHNSQRHDYDHLATQVDELVKDI